VGGRCRPAARDAGVGSKRFYRRTNLPLVEGWMLLSAAIALCVVGAVIDAA
jgi:hypothetical protein